MVFRINSKLGNTYHSDLPHAILPFQSALLVLLMQNNAVYYPIASLSTRPSHVRIGGSGTKTIPSHIQMHLIYSLV